MKIGDKILKEWTDFTVAGNRVTLVTDLLELIKLPYEDNGKLLIRPRSCYLVESVATHKVLKFKEKPNADKIHKKKVERMLKKHNLDYSKIPKIKEKVIEISDS